MIDNYISLKMKTTQALTALICILISIAMFNFGIIFVKNVFNDLDTNCKTCSAFDKNCPYTDEELIEQEYNFTDPYCSDMGIYEMKFKMGSMFFFGTGMGFLAVGILNLWHMRKKPKKVSRRQKSKRKK